MITKRQREKIGEQFAAAIVEKRRSKQAFPRREAQTILMGGGKGKPTKVIDGENLIEYVGIGWITLRKAAPSDLRKYPKLTEGEPK